MTPARLRELTDRYRELRLAVVGDFCLDRYLEIDPARAEISIETGLPVHNVVRVRPQPGAAGTVLNNLVSLGVGTIFPVGFCGEDGEGYELLQCLRALPGVDLTHFAATPLRRTFTYCKPMVMEPGQPPRELSRLDSKNWTPTPDELARQLARSLAALHGQCDAIIVMDQVDLAETGVVTRPVLEELRKLSASARQIPVLADSRRGLRGYPPCVFKMNANELAKLTGVTPDSDLAEIQRRSVALAARNQQPVFITLAERGLISAQPSGATEHVPAVPVRGLIDVVGAGDAVTANLACALTAGATPREALELAALAASVVIHQLGTSGAANPQQMQALLPR
jgi:rfaE bifunctional protein kinase chain/domain